MKIGKILGIPVKIHWSMLLFAAVCFFMGLKESVLLVTGAVLLHEFSHAAAARILGVQVSEVQLFPFGGQATIEDFTAMHPMKEIGIALAGPAASFLLAGLFSFFLPPQASPWGEAFIQINRLLFLFNLLPALPLDGGRIVRAALSSLTGYRRATRLTAGTGQLLGSVFVLLGISAFVNGQGLQQLLIGSVLFWTACREQRFFGYSFLRFLMNHRKQLDEKAFLPVKALVCMRQTEVRQILEDVSVKYYLMVTVVDEQHRIVANHSESQLLQAFMEKGPGVRLQEL